MVMATPTGSGMTLIASAVALTVLPRCLPIRNVYRQLAEGNTGRSNGYNVGVDTYVHWESTGGLDRGPVRGKVHAGILARATVDSPLPPGSGGRNLLLIRAADPPPRISHVVKSSYNARPPSRPTIAATCKGMFYSTAGTCSLRGPVCHRKNTPL